MALPEPRILGYLRWLAESRGLEFDVSTPAGYDRLWRESRQHLVTPWSLGENETRTREGTAFPRSTPRFSRREDLNVSGLSAFGRYLRRDSDGLGKAILTDRHDSLAAIEDLFHVFERTGLVARGEVVVVEDRLGITMTEIIKGDRS